MPREHNSLHAFEKEPEATSWHTRRVVCGGRLCVSKSAVSARECGFLAPLLDHAALTSEKSKANCPLCHLLNLFCSSLSVVCKRCEPRAALRSFVEQKNIGQIWAVAEQGVGESRGPFVHEGGRDMDHSWPLCSPQLTDIYTIYWGRNRTLRGSTSAGYVVTTAAFLLMCSKRLSWVTAVRRRGGRADRAKWRKAM